jgi:peptide deformylase
MTKLQVYNWPHYTLSQVSIPCEPTEYKDDFEQQMKTLMVESNGIGLAANQIGMTQRFFCIGHKYFMHFKEPTVIYNPMIITKSKEEMVDEEGCLSFPNVLVKVKRPKGIEVAYQDNKGKTHTARLIGYEAKCFQHENDHLDGICFNMKSKTRWSLKKTLRPRKVKKDHRFI